MDRKVEKLTEVLDFADSAGLQVITYFYQWFDEQAIAAEDRRCREVYLLVSAGSRVLKKLFLEKVRDLSAFDSKGQVLSGYGVSESEQVSPGGKRAEEIKKLLMAELLEVAQRANAGRILQAGYETGRNSLSEPLVLSWVSES